MMNTFTIAAILGSLSLGALAQVFLRKGMIALTMPPAPSGAFHIIAAVVANPWVWAGLICYGASMAPWLFVLSRLPVSAAYPLVSIGYILTGLLGWFFLGEVVTSSRVGGIMLICAGVALIARSL